MLVEAAAEYAVFLLSPTGVVSSWNLGAQRIKGYRADQIIGQHFSVFYEAPEREAGVPERELADAVSNGRTEVQGWRVRRDGSRFWAAVLIVPLWDEARHLRGFAKLTRDQTDWRAAEVANERLTQLAERERVASSLAGTLVRKLFAVGLTLDAVTKMVEAPEARRHVEEAKDGLDDAIKYLRRAVFDITGTRGADLRGGPAPSGDGKA